MYQNAHNVGHIGIRELLQSKHRKIVVVAVVVVVVVVVVAVAAAVVDNVVF